MGRQPAVCVAQFSVSYRVRSALSRMLQPLPLTLVASSQASARFAAVATSGCAQYLCRHHRNRRRTRSNHHCNKPLP